MGRGDRRTRRSKIWRGSNGNTRPKQKKTNRAKRAAREAAAANA